MGRPSTAARPQSWVVTPELGHDAAGHGGEMQLTVLCWFTPISSGKQLHDGTTSRVQSSLALHAMSAGVMAQGDVSKTQAGPASEI